MSKSRLIRRNSPMQMLVGVNFGAVKHSIYFGMYTRALCIGWGFPCTVMTLSACGWNEICHVVIIPPLLKIP